MNNFWRFRAPAIVWALTLFVVSSIPDLSSPLDITEWDDKMEHFLAYAIFGALLIRALAMRRSLPIARDFVLAVVLGILFAMTDEWHQHFVPGRSMDALDFVADAIGAVFGARCYQWLCQRWALHRRVGMR